MVTGKKDGEDSHENPKAEPSPAGPWVGQGPPPLDPRRRDVGPAEKGLRTVHVAQRVEIDPSSVKSLD